VSLVADDKDGILLRLLLSDDVDDGNDGDDNDAGQNA
jgi:hypothetical protein